MYVILSSRDGQYRTEPDAAMATIESYDYLFYGRRRARFVIADLNQAAKVRIVDIGPPERAGMVPTRLLPQFPSVEAARQALHELVNFGSLDVRLELCTMDTAGDAA